MAVESSKYLMRNAFLRGAGRAGGDSLGLAVALAIVSGALVALPVLGIFGSFWDVATAADTLRHLLATVMPRAMVETATLAVGVGLGVVVLGASTAWFVAT